MDRSCSVFFFCLELGKKSIPYRALDYFVDVRCFMKCGGVQGIISHQGWLVYTGKNKWQRKKIITYTVHISDRMLVKPYSWEQISMSTIILTVATKKKLKKKRSPMTQVFYLILNLIVYFLLKKNWNDNLTVDSAVPKPRPFYYS